MSTEQDRDPRRVFVVHGRDMRTRNSMFELLRTFDLHPLEWTEVVRATGNTMPSILEILTAGFQIPQAVIVLLTPDDLGILRRQYQDRSTDPDYESKLVGQARLNVIFEAGIACALFPKSTIFVELGQVRPFTDIGGINTVRISQGGSWKTELRRRLHTSGCAVSDNDAWQKVPGFTISFVDRWTEYDENGRKHEDLLDRSELDEARRGAEQLGSRTSAYCLISSVQEAYDMAYWAMRCRANRNAASLLTEFLINSPFDHGRPRFRAARVLEMFDANLREEALNAAQSAGGRAALPLNADLLKAARSLGVEEYSRSTELIKSEDSRQQLLIEISTLPKMDEVRLLDAGED
ncbi:putative nucleotide-binding protein with TIR-like domain [Streptomyces sp. 846.5]|nr:nucleotide-binding protein [Streptomyces sp. 846.5]TDU05838.1 putative nucleotide-binding protein with TIR-like domain [Streptomyces sp. 846.5]